MQVLTGKILLFAGSTNGFLLGKGKMKLLTFLLASERSVRRHLAGIALSSLPRSLFLFLVIPFASHAQTLQLHPANPHYFLWRGKPVILITSGEHYGAVLNLDFDFAKYLRTLEADQLNLTRTFAGGTYYEPHGAFNIAQNSMAPADGRFIAPWARSDTPGCAGGGNKFDLTRWNPEYFSRLREFMREASGRGVVVEMNLFCPFYDESQWKLSPLHPSNNVNGLSDVARTNVYTLDKHAGRLTYQEKMVRKLVAELREFDNIYYEICNEPYFGGVTVEWQHHIADVIVEAQKDHPNPKLISQNIANKSAKITHPHPAVSIFNFHYATPPEAVLMNFQLNKVLGDNETGFRGTNDAPYRTEAWQFILAGGGLYNNLDYSFTAGHEDGTFVYPATQPGGGNPVFRKQLRILQEFMKSFDFIRMSPDRSSVKGHVPAGLETHTLSELGKAYAVYLRLPAPDPSIAVRVEIELPPGQYKAEWVDPLGGAVEKTEDIKLASGAASLIAPEFAEDIALRIKRTSP